MMESTRSSECGPWPHWFKPSKSRPELSAHVTEGLHPVGKRLCPAPGSRCRDCMFLFRRLLYELACGCQRVGRGYRRTMRCSCRHGLTEEGQRAYARLVATFNRRASSG